MIGLLTIVLSMMAGSVITVFIMALMRASSDR